MNEIIYVDHQRLNSYIEQIDFREKRGIKLDIDKITYKFPFEFGINSSVSKDSGKYNETEKINCVWSYIQALNAYQDIRPGIEGVKYLIVREFIDLNEIFLEKISKKNEIILRFWASKINRNDQDIILLLASNIKYCDMPPGIDRVDNWSTYTALHRFLYDFREEINQSTMRDYFSDNFWDRNGSLGSEEHPLFLSQDVNLDIDMISDFTQNLELFFRSKGGLVAGKRKVEVVYVVRDHGHPHRDAPYHVFGYPLWIIQN
ncbi:hypothetical protein [Roseibium aggregatum]|uniref:Uncharacterized protein n=1 Tax=Roseibium aggregatum TaxID=187304 RepID=A0A939J1P9_9HYPH|nr:hypothetical protein [Roseibium aggregatum]MBN9668697.1 hypothetical protein [Roseibium aggregatum]